MTKMLSQRWDRSCEHLKVVVAAARRITVCVDVWSKSNLTCSFLGISACFFDPRSQCRVARHVVLNVKELEHPHTGDCLADAIDDCLRDWGIPSGRVLMVVSDNGSNMVKAIRLLNERAAAADENEDSDTEMAAKTDDDEEGDMTSDEDGIEINDDGNGDGNSANADTVDMEAAILYPQMICMAHTLQLVVKKAYVHYDAVLTKARRLVARVRKSGVAVESCDLRLERCCRHTMRPTGTAHT